MIKKGLMQLRYCLKLLKKKTTMSNQINFILTISTATHGSISKKRKRKIRTTQPDS